MKKYMIHLVRLLLGCEQASGSGYLSSVRKLLYIVVVVFFFFATEALQLKNDV